MERVFNYRLSRARRIVENAFGILANRFQVLLTTMRQQPETVQMVVTACVCLHNLLRMRNPGPVNDQDQDDEDHNVIPGTWRENTNLVGDHTWARGGNKDTRQAKDQRDYLSAYYYSPAGAVPWQMDMI